MSKDRANIVLIQVESMDGRAMGCMGHPAAHTPHLDRLAERGVLFRNAYCNSPQCTPSRASMWSGRHVHSVAAWNNATGLCKDHPTFATRLGDEGYNYGCVGRTDHRSGGHFALPILTRCVEEPVFIKDGPRAELVEEPGGRTREVDWRRARRAADWLDEARSDADPFLLYYGTLHVHPGGGFITTQRWLEKIDEDAVTQPPQTPETHPVMSYMRVAKGCDREFSDGELLTIRRHYYAMVAEVDALLGPIFEQIERLGLWEDTWVVFSADHGEMNMEHGQYLKNAQYEAAARVPLIVAGPGAERGRVVEDPVSLLDVYPTLMEIAGLDAHRAEGRSLVGYLSPGADLAPRPVLGQYHSNLQPTGSFMLREGDWKYIAYPGYRPQLFNLSEDPHELDNLAEECADVTQRMDTELREFLDYPAVDARVKELDRARFRAWRAGLGEERYRRVMKSWSAHRSLNWNPRVADAIDAWCEGSQALRRAPRPKEARR